MTGHVVAVGASLARLRTAQAQLGGVRLRLPVLTQIRDEHPLVGELAARVESPRDPPGL